MLFLAVAGYVLSGLFIRNYVAACLASLVWTTVIILLARELPHHVQLAPHPEGAFNLMAKAFGGLIATSATFYLRQLWQQCREAPKPLEAPDPNLPQLQPRGLDLLRPHAALRGVVRSGPPRQ
jgi:hypothetical protein